MKDASAKLEEHQLLEIFERLPPAHQDTLISFAEFLSERSDGREAASRGEIVPIARPAAESVAMAIHRLVMTYPMLDRRKLMAEATQFMAQHALEGRDAREVIDELEGVFRRHYRKMRAEE